MTRRASLWRKIATRMALVTLAGFASAAFAALFLYAWVFENHSDAAPRPSEWVPHEIDYLVIGGSVGVAVLIAVVAGAQLARRIVMPVNGLAEAARRIAGGDLKARANVDDETAGEVATLVEDFNRMADRLESLTTGMVDWNAAIAHELRTPVTILKGRLQGVADGVFEIDERTLTSLLRQVDGLARLVEDLRVVSLADVGRLELRLELIDLAQIVGELQAAVGQRLAEAGFACDWRLEPALVLGDPVRLRQAVLALLENALVHATPGGLTIRSGTLAAGEAGVAVEDEGPGLTPEDAAVIFEPFQRASSRTQGSGLGLAVVRQIAQAHGGAIRHRPHNAGSTFELVLPVRQGASAPD